MSKLNPSSDPIVLRLLPALYEQPASAFAYVQRRIFLRCPNIILQDLANLPFDQFTAQTETHLAEHFDGKVGANVVRFALYGLRQRLSIPRSGIAPVGSAGKWTLVDTLGIPLIEGFKQTLLFADLRIQQAWERLPETDAVFLKFFRKNAELLLNLVRSWTKGRSEQLARDIAQSTWEAALLLFDPNREWTFKFVERIAFNLLREEWTRRHKWNEVRFLKSLREDELGDDSYSNVDCPRHTNGTGMSIEDLEEETRGPEPFEAWQAAVRAVMNAPCPPLHRMMYVAVAMLERPPRFIVRDDSRMFLADFAARLECEFARKSRLTPELVSELFKPLRRDLVGTLAATVRDRRYLDPYPRLRRRVVGATRIRDYFKSRDITRQAEDISRWADIAKWHVWRQAQQPGSDLFRALQELDPDWWNPPPPPPPPPSPGGKKRR